MISDAALIDWTKADAADTATLRRLEQAAIAAIERRTGRYLGVVATRVEIVQFRGFPASISNVPIGGSLTSLEQWDGSAWSVVSPADYYLYGSNVFSNGTSAMLGVTQLRATYQGGYTVDAGDPNVWPAPADIQQAVLLLVGHWFENRESVVVGTITSELAQGLDMLLDAHTRVTV